MNNIKKNLLVSIIPVVGLMSSLHANAADNNWYSGILVFWYSGILVFLLAQRQ